MKFVPVPDNDTAFYAFVNLVINNRNNQNKPTDVTRRPKKIGPADVTYTINECGEVWIDVYTEREKRIVENIIDQFCLIRTHWETIAEEIEYPTSDKY